MTSGEVRLEVVLLALLTLGLASAAGSRAEVVLRLDPVELPDQDASVEFVLSDATPVDPDTEAVPPMTELFCKSAGDLRVCAQLGAIGPAKFAGFEYPFYVLDDDGDEAELTRFLFLGIPRGRFFDRREPVRFAVGEVQEGEEADLPRGSITLPLHAERSDHYLTVRTDMPIEKVELGGGESIWLTLSSGVEDLPVLVSDVEAFPTEKRLWRRVGVSRTEEAGDEGDEAPPLRVEAGQGPARLVEIFVQPSPLDALWQSVFPFPSAPGDESAEEIDENKGPQGVHDRILVRVSYRAEGGNVRYLHYEIPVRFVPSFPALILSVVVGALVGCAIPPLLGRRHWKDWVQATAAALGIAFILELVALVLWNFDSRLKVLGFEVDPYQILPVVLLGVAVGLGGYRGAAMLPGLRSPAVKGEKAQGEADGGEGEARAEPEAGGGDGDEGGDPR